MQKLYKVLLGSAVMMCAALAQAQSTDTTTSGTSGSTASQPSSAMPAAGSSAMGGKDSSSGASTSDKASASGAGSATSSTDPFVEKRDATSKAKKEYKGKQISKEDYRKEKKEENARLKATGKRSDTEKNLDVSTPGTSGSK